jgi:hypothetical protein
MTTGESRGASAFSPDYATARARFRAAAEARGFRLEAFVVEGTGPAGEPLAVDAAVLGPDRPERVLVLSSGLHGVEGFFGSAVQLAWLGLGLRGGRPGPGDAVVLLHALNPYGFAWLRRFDGNNVDLNRNFLLDGEGYAGSPPGYARLDPLLNPPHAPRAVDLFVPRALTAVARYGMPTLKAAVASGQYDFPRGLFFGGRGPSELRAILAANLPRWVGDAGAVLHLDFHTGLGRWADYKLLIEPDVAPERVEWLRGLLGADKVEAGAATGIAYETRGDIGSWFRSALAAPGRRCDSLCAEFGTYTPLRVIAALRAENQAHHWLGPDHPASDRARARLREAFAPADRAWRDATVSRALDLIDRAAAGVFG